MKAVAEVIAAILLALGVVAMPYELLNLVKKEATQKVNSGIFSLEDFTKKIKSQ